MKTGSVLTLALAVVLGVASVPCAARAGDAPDAQIVAVAGEGVRAFLRGVPDEQLGRFGFASQAEVGASVVAQAFRIYTVPPAAFLDDRSAGDLVTLAVPTDLWQFLVTNNGKPAALLTVDRVAGSWAAVSIGSAGLADQLGQMMAAWPAAAGHDYRIIRIYQALSDFVEISRQGTVLGLLPTTSALVALGRAASFVPSDLGSAQDLFNDLKPVVRQHLEMERGR